MRQRVGANSSKKNKGRVNFTMKEGKHVSTRPFLHSGTGNWSLSLLCNLQGRDLWGLQFGGISLSCVSCNKAFRSSKAWTLVIVLRKARSRIFHKCVTHAYLFHGQATQDGCSLALCASPASVGAPAPCEHYQPSSMLPAGPSW